MTHEQIIEPLAERRVKPIRGLRWYIIAMIFVVTVVNYIDRMTLSVLAPTIRETFSLTNTDYSRIVFMFLLAYTIAQSAMGKFLDKVGTRIGFIVFVSIWSVASMLHATAKSGVHLAIYRFFLGIGEGGNWPGAAKVAAEWFPVRERALAMAIFNGGSSIGAVIAPPLIVWVTLTFGWKAAFFVGSLLSSVFLVLWIAFFRSPHEHPRLGDEERAMIASDHAEQERTTGAEQTTQQATYTHRKPRWREFFQYRQVWALVLTRFFTDPVWWFYISWLPNYLKNERHFSLELIGLLAWIPFLFADVGNLAGGALSSLLIKRGWTVDAARKLTMYAGTLLMPAGMVAVFTESNALALAGISTTVFAFQFFNINLLTTPSDCFSKRDVGSVAGIGGTAAGVGSMLFTLAVGYLVDNVSYTPVFVAVSVFGPIGALIIWTVMQKIERVA
jgi:ACS family hexuronate transporter-like MFS transporter